MQNTGYFIQWDPAELFQTSLKMSGLLLHLNVNLTAKHVPFFWMRQWYQLWCLDHPNGTVRGEWFDNNIIMLLMLGTGPRNILISLVLTQTLPMVSEISQCEVWSLVGGHQVKPGEKSNLQVQQHWVQAYHSPHIHFNLVFRPPAAKFN